MIVSNGTTYLPSNTTANLIQSKKSSISELVAYLSGRFSIQNVPLEIPS